MKIISGLAVIMSTPAFPVVADSAAETFGASKGSFPTPLAAQTAAEMRIEARD
jgi:hypothetical protein